MDRAKAYVHLTLQTLSPPRYKNCGEHFPCRSSTSTSRGGQGPTHPSSSTSSQGHQRPRGRMSQRAVVSQGRDAVGRVGETQQIQTPLVDASLLSLLLTQANQASDPFQAEVFSCAARELLQESAKSVPGSKSSSSTASHQPGQPSSSLQGATQNKVKLSRITTRPPPALIQNPFSQPTQDTTLEKPHPHDCDPFGVGGIFHHHHYHHCNHQPRLFHHRRHRRHYHPAHQSNDHHYHHHS